MGENGRGVHCQGNEGSDAQLLMMDTNKPAEPEQRCRTSAAHGVLDDTPCPFHFRSGCTGRRFDGHGRTHGLHSFGHRVSLSKHGVSLSWPGVPCHTTVVLDAMSGPSSPVHELFLLPWIYFVSVDIDLGGPCGPPHVLGGEKAAGQPSRTAHGKSRCWK